MFLGFQELVMAWKVLKFARIGYTRDVGYVLGREIYRETPTLMYDQAEPPTTGQLSPGWEMVLWGLGSICDHFQVEIVTYSDSPQDQVLAPLCNNLVFGKANILALKALKMSSLNIQFLAHSLWYLNINKTFGVMWTNSERRTI